VVGGGHDVADDGRRVRTTRLRTRSAAGDIGDNTPKSSAFARSHSPRSFA
jgi:hypothetical protein